MQRRKGARLLAEAVELLCARALQPLGHLGPICPQPQNAPALNFDVLVVCQGHGNKIAGGPCAVARSADPAVQLCCGAVKIYPGAMDIPCDWSIFNHTCAASARCAFSIAIVV